MVFLTSNVSALRHTAQRLQSFELAFFLLTCFILGGTSQDVVAPKFALYLLSLVVIGRRITMVNSDSFLWEMKPVLMICGTFLCLTAAYAVPIPPSIWSALPGRGVVVEGFELAGAPLPWLPLSLSPEMTLFSMFDCLPPLAVVLLLGTRRRSSDIKYALLAIAIFVIGSVFLASLQVLKVTEALYFYEITNRDVGVGFFSNTNHFGGFLVLALPFIAALFSASSESKRDRSSATQALCLVASLAVLMGVVLSRSLAGFILLGPVAATALYIISRHVHVKRFWLLAILGAALVLVLTDIFLFKNVWPELVDRLSKIGSDNRKIMRATTLEAAHSFFPIGSGIGSFEEVYRLFEGFGKKTVPHAHNEYVELFLELGLLGLIWFAALFTCLGRYIWKAVRLLWATDTQNRLARYMAIPLVTIAVHSTVDYSSRTIAVMVLVIFAFCLLVAPPRQKSGQR